MCQTVDCNLLYIIFLLIRHTEILQVFLSIWAFFLYNTASWKDSDSPQFPFLCHFAWGFMPWRYLRSSSCFIHFYCVGKMPILLFYFQKVLIIWFLFIYNGNLQRILWKFLSGVLDNTLFCLFFMIICVILYAKIFLQYMFIHRKQNWCKTVTYLIWWLSENESYSLVFSK